MAMSEERWSLQTKGSEPGHAPRRQNSRDRVYYQASVLCTDICLRTEQRRALGRQPFGAGAGIESQI